MHPLSTYTPLFSPLILIPYLYLKHIDPHLPLPHPKHIFSLLSFAYPPLSSFTVPPSSSTTPIPIFPSTFHVSMFLSTMPFLSLQPSPLYSLFPSPSLPTLMSPSSSCPPPYSLLLPHVSHLYPHIPIPKPHHTLPHATGSPPLSPCSQSPQSLLHPHTHPVMITPYLSRDTTYCYRHCKGISHFPLLLYHPSPRPMPDRITSASLTLVYAITPYRTHDSKPHHVHCLTDSLVPRYLYPFPLHVILTYDSNPDSDLILSIISL